MKTKEDFNLREELDEIHQLVVKDIKFDLESDDPIRRAIARREAMQLLKQNGISAAAMPDNAAGEMARMVGKLQNFTAIAEKISVRATLPLPTNARAIAQGDTVEVPTPRLVKPEPEH